MQNTNNKLSSYHQRLQQSCLLPVGRIGVLIFHHHQVVTMNAQPTIISVDHYEQRAGHHDQQQASK